ncbi:hypothetical protein LNKW23_22230 [Paralimibaculum aggregatum]|uniref:ABC transmembrane type-1 domain-containing protein n=1 Tax=Paralimibaculum aggregatum TaxID=3036245 RepID=A0ABQ6LIA5_9RHOB|nr:hypothetical protein LNKW23_22230 [Limibaculum sp. NKW23]
MTQGPDAEHSGDPVVVTSAPTATRVASDYAFVAEGQIPPAPPPPGSSGPLLWVRENLFPDLLNATLTLITIALLVWMLPGIYQWAIGHAILDANSLDECRQRMDELYGEGERGACWAIINERIQQFLYGRYPEELRWRPTLAFLLLFPAAAPVLFSRPAQPILVFFAVVWAVWGFSAWWPDEGFDAMTAALILGPPLIALGLARIIPPVRRFLLVFSVLFPAVAYFLIWGGSIWGPILVVATPVIAYVVYWLVERMLDDTLGEELANTLAMIASIFAVAFWLLFGVAAVDEALTRAVADTRIPDRVAMLDQVIADPEAEDAARAAARRERSDLLALDEQRAEISGLRLALEKLSTESVATPEGAKPVADFVHEDLDASPELAAASMQALSPEDQDLAEAYQTTESRLIGEQTRIWTIYKNFGRVGIEQVESAQLGGFLLTLIIGVTAIAGSLPIGILLALGRRSGLIFIRMVAVTIIEAIRGVPLITLLFVASSLLNYFLPPGTSFDIILRVLILVTLFASAYVAEAIRGGLAALPKGQYEAGDAMGLTYAQSMRLIILPQALKISIPSIVNIFIGVFKDSTLVSIIGLFDPLGVIAPILADSRWQGIYAETYVFVAALFFVCCFGMSRYSMYLERKLKTDHR